MAGKRARGRSQDAGNSNEEKKIKTEQPSGGEESIFEAARRRREARNAPSKDSGAATSSSRAKVETGIPNHGMESYEAWEKRWKGTYPNKVVRAVGDVRKRTQASASSSSQNLPPSVYVVIHHGYGPYVDDELDILGTYTTAASANEHVMVHVADKYGHICERVPEDWVKGEYDKYENVWNVDSDGCLSITGNGVDGSTKVFVAKSTVFK